ncbi:MAG: hypothetical protein P8Y54_04045 [Xanthomonadales bacterium]
MSAVIETKNTYDLFMGYLDTINEALDTHADTPVIGQVLSLMEKAGTGKKFGAAIYKSDPQSPFDYFTVRLANGKFELVARGKDDPDIDWRVSQEFLVSVNEDPQKYVDNPAMLDLDWLKTRLGF